MRFLAVDRRLLVPKAFLYFPPAVSGAGRLRRWPLQQDVELHARWRADPAHSVCAGERVSAGAPMAEDYVDMVDTFRSVARQDPDRPAFVEDNEDGAVRAISYGELDASSSRLAGYFRDQGLSAGDFIVVGIPNSIAFVQVVVAAARSGIRIILLSEHAAAACLRLALDSFPVSGAVIDPAFSDTLAEEGSGLGAMVILSAGAPIPGWPSLQAALSGPRDAFIEPSYQKSDAAVVLFTSGSTGVPKAIVKARANFGRSGLPASHDRLLITAPLHYLPGIMAVLAYLLRSGGAGILSRTRTPRHLLELLGRHRCTATSVVPALATMWLSQLGRVGDLDLSSLERMWIGGGPLRPEVLKQLKVAFPTVDIVYAYGLTECPSVISPQGRTDAPEGTIGRLHESMEGRLVSETGEFGDVGELWLRGAAISRPVAPARAVSGQGDDAWLKTGDILRIDSEGWYYFLGRKDDMYVRGAEKFYPAQAEAVLARHPLVQDVCVVPVDDRVLGQVPCALIVPHPEMSVTMADLVEYCVRSNQHIYCPQYMLTANELCLLPSGKVDRSAVRALFDAVLDAAPTLGLEEGDLEAIIARNWREATRQVVPDWDADFFDAPVDSLSIALFVALLGSVCRAPVSFGDVLDHPSVRALAAHLRRLAEPAVETGLSTSA
jgi:acyl-CoA synthetase (AMP-forming)/AMP-acid ligase II